VVWKRSKTLNRAACAGNYGSASVGSVRTVACLFLALASFCPGRAQMASPAAPLDFSGTGVSETTTFTMGPRWEVRWNGAPVGVTVEQADGTIMAGGTSTGAGSIFVAAAGTYKLHLAPWGNETWRVQVVTLGAPGSVEASGSGVYIPPDMTPSAGPPGGGVTEEGMPHGVHTVTPTTAAAPKAPGGTTPVTVTPPTGNSTASTTAPASPTPAAPSTNAGAPAKMTELQARAVVVIKGDNAEGTGFLVKTATGPMVITNQHVIEANPHLQIITSDGQTVKYTDLEGAADRDLAMIPIQDNNYSYLELATDVGNTVQVGDAVVTPGNSEGGDVLLNTTGQVVALGPQKVEISNPIFHGNSGGPIFHVKSGKVIGVVTEAMKVETGNDLDKASFDNHNSAITGQMRYFGLRLDTVPRWDAYTWTRFENETEFLREFHERSKCLDSYLNTATDDNSEWGLYYLNDEKLKEANQQAADLSNGGDTSQRLEGSRTMVFSLDAVADTSMDQIQVPGNFYPYDQTRARDEISYRQALRKEIEGMSDDINRIGGLARRSD
jgi:cell division septation protein DedD